MNLRLIIHTASLSKGRGGKSPTKNNLATSRPLGTHLRLFLQPSLKLRPAGNHEKFTVVHYASYFALSKKSYCGT